MKLPKFENVWIPKEKIEGYLLSIMHRDGKSKAAFFTSMGFSAEKWTVLASALRQYVADNEVFKVEKSPFGTRYVVEGPMMTPNKKEPLLRSVWFVEEEGEVPRFVTSYPLRRRM